MQSTESCTRTSYEPKVNHLPRSAGNYITFANAANSQENSRKQARKKTSTRAFGATKQVDGNTAFPISAGPGELNEGFAKYSRITGCGPKRLGPVRTPVTDSKTIALLDAGLAAPLKCGLGRSQFAQVWALGIQEGKMLFSTSVDTRATFDSWAAEMKLYALAIQIHEDGLAQASPEAVVLLWRVRSRHPEIYTLNHAPAPTYTAPLELTLSAAEQLVLEFIERNPNVPWPVDTVLWVYDSEQHGVTWIVPPRPFKRNPPEHARSALLPEHARSALLRGDRVALVQREKRKEIQFVVVGKPVST